MGTAGDTSDGGARPGSAIAITRRDNVLILETSRFLDVAACADLQAAIEDAADEADTRAVVICADGGAGFPSDGEDLTPEALGALTAGVAASHKPVVACLAGRVIGAGAALALAAHWRVVAEGTRIGWPEVGQGRVPVGGATQRLPRLVGAQAALDLFLAGRTFPMDKPMLSALVDVTPETGFDLLEAAVEFAGDPACEVRPTDARRDGFGNGATYAAEVALRRDKTGQALQDAAAQTVAAVEAAILMPIAQGLAFEASVAADCAASPTAKARAALGLAERRSMQRGGAKVTSLSIAGDGRTASGLAIAGLDAGLTVRLVGAGATRVTGQISATYDHAVQRSRMTAQHRAERLDRLVTEARPSDVPAGEVVVITDPNAALETWPDGTILALATPEAEMLGPNSLSIAVPPLPHVRRGIELGRGGATSDHAMAQAMAAFGAINRVTVSSMGPPPRALTRLQMTLNLAVDALVVAGVPPERLDAALRGAGWAVAPFLARDTAGLSDAEPDATMTALFPPACFVPLDAALVAAGRTGRMSGAGYYDYETGKPVPDPAVTAILSDIAALTDPGWSDDRLVELISLALANEGARLVADEIVDQAVSVDLLAVHGLGLPRDTGGVMLWADIQGLVRVERHLRLAADDLGPLWTPHALWSDKVKNGARMVEV